MFGRSKHQPQGEIATLKINGMHCTSCSLTIDGALEDLAGVIRSSTNYAKSQTKVEYTSGVVSLAQLTQTIESLGYTVQLQPGD